MSPGALGGTQFPTFDSRTGVPSENVGLATPIAATSQAVLNFHVINSTSKPTLREAWLNYYYIDPAKVTGRLGTVFLDGGIGFYITPGTHQTYKYTCSPTFPTRILWLTNHMHAHALRMTVYKVSGSDQSKLLESYSWEDPTILYYDSDHTNAPADPAAKIAGADVSGEVVVNPSDQIQWECEINNTSSTTLTFRNEVNTGEMCIAAGSMVRADDPTQPGDFRCTRN